MACVPFDFQRFFDNLLTKIGRERCGFGEDFCAQVQPAQPHFGDFQANGVLVHGKKLKKNPRQLAQDLVDALRKEKDFLDGKFFAEVAGAGFINLILSPETLCDWLETFYGEEKICASISDCAGKTFVIDYSCPNSAKQMHVGHLRSLVIGDAIANLLEFFGAKVLRDNHIGDWGTQFGILLMQIRRENIDLGALDTVDAIETLEALYRRGSEATKNSELALREAREELVALQNGDAYRLQLWEKINSLSYATFQEIYDLTNVHFDYVLGESFYRNSVDRVCNELRESGIAQNDDGALLVFFPENERFSEQPFLIRKSDGASNYATTDLATVLYRTEHFHADSIIYVTDARQQDHFQQLFLTVQKWFPAMQRPLPQLHHVWFGTVCGEDGKAIKTRSGEPIKLKALFSEAVRRAYEIVAEKNPELDEENRQNVARAVGVGAIKYGDLSQNRTSDYGFSWSKMLAFEGNTAPYLQYAVARIHAIFRRASVPATMTNTQTFSPIETPEERALARKLIQFPVVLRQSLADLRLHLLCVYLFELAGEFSAFYNANKVLEDNELIRQRRLILCARTLLILTIGLRLLGLEILERM